MLAFFDYCTDRSSFLTENGKLQRSIRHSAKQGPATCAILTTTPNELVASVHDRMPVILKAAAIEKWLGVDPPVEEELASVLASYESDCMKATPASSRLDTARYDAVDVLIADEPVQQSLAF